MDNRIGVYKIRLIRERWVVFPPFTADQPQVAALFFHRLIGQADREHSAVLFLDIQGRATGASIVGIGSLTTTPMPAREVFKAALLANACEIVLSHNHTAPGCHEPSDQDIRLTRKLIAAGSIVGVHVRDHIIVTPTPGEFTSMREAKLLAVA